MTVIKYTLDRPTDIYRNWGFMYSIEWPVSGPEHLLEEGRSYIASVVENKDLIVDNEKIAIALNKGDISVSNFIQANYKQ